MYIPNCSQFSIEMSRNVTFKESLIWYINYLEKLNRAK